MATPKTIKATASYEKDTAKGKHRLRVSGSVVGILYIDGNLPAEEFEVTLVPKS